MKKKNVLFTYGTLMKGYGNHHLVSGCPFLGKAEMRGPYGLWSNDYYPVVRKLDNGSVGVIKGEAYVVPDEALNTMDDFERRYGYERKSVKIAVGGKTIKASVYIFMEQRLPSESFEFRRSGSFRSRRDYFL
jgi:gamma-glutamylcyclotransferase (GGCT)/AIG2-like uncharacterized protein YtfP